jgi:hypothetical protein
MPNFIVLEKFLNSLDNPKKFYENFPKSGHFISIYFNKVCFLGKYAERKCAVNTVKTNPY